MFGIGELVRSAGRLIARATGEILEAAFRLRVVPGGMEVCPTRKLLPVPIEFLSEENARMISAATPTSTPC